MRKEIAIIIGHRSKAQGAFSETLNQTEYEFNKKVVSHLSDCADIYERKNTPFVSEAYRIRQLSKKVNAAGSYKLVISLHFNSFEDKRAHGVEALHYITNNFTKRICVKFVNKVSQRFGIKRRALIAVRSKRQNGGLLISSLNSPAILLEPFFGSNTADAEKFKGKEFEYAQLIRELIDEL